MIKVRKRMRTHLFWRLICWLKGTLSLYNEGKEMVEAIFAKHNIGWIDPERGKLYRGLKWSVMKISLRDIGIWDKAQGMPHEWCTGNILNTAEFYRENSCFGGYYHENIKRLLKEEVGDVIVVDGRLKRGRERCLDTKWSIDDGCMRTMVSALRGETHIRCYAGRILKVGTMTI